MRNDATPLDPKLFDLTSAMVKEGLGFVDNVRQRGYTIKAYENWPELSWSDGMPEFNFFTADPPLDYKNAFNPFWSLFLFDSDRSSDRLFEFEKHKPFQDLKKYVRSEQFPKHVFPNDLPDGLLDSALKLLIERSVDRFIHLNGGTSFDMDKFLDVYLPLEAGLLLEELPIEIQVPVLRLTAASDSYDLDGGISLAKMSDSLQLARAFRDHDTHEVNEHLLYQASHALVIRDHILPNAEYHRHFGGFTLSLDTAEIVDAFFACLRIITGLDTGYAQIIFVPLGWAHHYEGSLQPLEGLTIRKYPPSLNPVSAFYGERFPDLSDAQVDVVRQLFANILTIRKSRADRRLQLAIKRLNSCYMREDQEDTILDATIGLELLLSDGDAQEVTHKLGLRMAALSTLVPDCELTPAEVFHNVKKLIYPYRSAVVHGDEKKANKISRATPGGAATAVRLAIQYLGVAVRALAAHPEFLTTTAIDEGLLLNRVNPRLASVIPASE
jgi:hypothetical protein